MVGALPDGFYAINGTFVMGLPITAYYILIITIAMWLILEYTPVGRYLYAIGANPRAAELNGIPTRKFVVGAFVTSGLMTALAGVLLASKLRIGQASVGLEFLLPALVGALFRINHHQARTSQCLGHDCGRCHFGSRYIRHSAIWWFVLGGAHV